MLLSGPVPLALELRLQVGEQQALLAPGRELAADFLGPLDGLVPSDALGLARQQDDVMARRAIFVQHDARPAFAVGQRGDRDVGQRSVREESLLLRQLLQPEIGKRCRVDGDFSAGDGQRD